MPLLAIVLLNAISGHCTRGDRCWFRHVLLKVAPDDDRIQFNAEMCCICLEKPTTYGLLSESPSHVATGGVVLNDAQRTAAMYSVSTSALRFVPYLAILIAHPVYPSVACSYGQITRCGLVRHHQMLSLMSHTISFCHTVCTLLSEW